MATQEELQANRDFLVSGILNPIPTLLIESGSLLLKRIADIKQSLTGQEVATQELKQEAAAIKLETAKIVEETKDVKGTFTGNIVEQTEKFIQTVNPFTSSKIQNILLFAAGAVIVALIIIEVVKDGKKK